MLEYYLVAFVDILGFSEMVRHDCHQGTEGPTYLPVIKESLLAARSENDAESYKIVQFSDSIIISHKFESEQETFISFIERVAKLQADLFSKGILSRGGIAHGKHSEDDGIIFSQALVEAYRLESSVAQFPRTVISADLLLLFKANLCSLALDTDGVTFVDFGRYIPSDLIVSILSQIVSASQSKDQRVGAKIRWVANYLAVKFPDLELEVKTISFH